MTYTDPTTGTVTTLATQTVEFDSTGNMITPASGLISTAGMTFGAGTGAPILNALDIDLTGTTQQNKEFSADGDINGSEPSEVAGYEISDDGILSVKYDNGDLVPKFRIAMANVQSPDMLTPLAGNIYTQSNDSGVVVMGYAGNSGYGTILSGALEDSNVDIAEELTSMIESQRNYTANSKVFQTGSELMDVLVNLVR